MDCFYWIILESLIVISNYNGALAMLMFQSLSLLTVPFDKNTLDSSISQYCESVNEFWWGLLPVSANRTTRVKRIVGAHITSATHHPYQIHLDAPDRGCGGSLIDSRHVLTAAHCVANISGRFYTSPIRIVGGIDKLGSKAHTRVFADVSKVYVPREYFDQGAHDLMIADIAVLKLKQHFNINPRAFLELPDNKTYDGVEASITGFGWNNVEMRVKKFALVEIGKTSGHLRHAQVKVQSQRECQRRHYGTIRTSHICAKIVPNTLLRPNGVCAGDSGGPLVYKKRTILGILSSSALGCIEIMTPAIYTRVSHYVNFIQSVRKNIKDSRIISKSLPTLKEHVECCFNDR